jgi:hypothetical protein
MTLLSYIHAKEGIHSDSLRLRWIYKLRKYGKGVIKYILYRFNKELLDSFADLTNCLCVIF